MNLMMDADWAEVKYFSPEENWGDPYRMEKDLILLLDDLRDVFDHPFAIHCGFDLHGHSKTSRHHVPAKDNDGNVLYLYADAADFHIEEIDFRDAVDLMLIFLDRLGRANKVGLGIYPAWNAPGFHLDTRGVKARWGAVNRNGRQVYVGFDEAYGLT